MVGSLNLKNVPHRAVQLVLFGTPCRLELITYRI